MAAKEEAMKATQPAAEWSTGRWIKPKEDRGIFQRGKVWYIRFVKNGKLITERSGLVKGDALNLVKLRKSQMDDERNHPEKHRAQILWDDIIDDLIEIKRQKSAKEYPDRKFDAGRYQIVRAWFAGRPAAKITAAEVRAKLASVGKRPATANRYRTVIGHIYKIALQNGKVDANANPVRFIEREHERNKIVRFLNQFADDEETRLRTAIRTSRYPQREAEVDLALNTGMRQQELYRLRWEDVNLLRGQITIQQPKSGETAEHVPINASARAALAKLRALYPKAELVAPLGYDSSHRRWWLSVLKSAKITKFRWHDLRHTFASRLVMAGVSIYSVKELMRHASVVTTERYAHLAPKHLHAEIATLDAPEKLIQVTDTTREMVQ
jgi:integrase